MGTVTILKTIYQCKKWLGYYNISEEVYFKERGGRGGGRVKEEGASQPIYADVTRTIYLLRQRKGYI